MLGGLRFDRERLERAAADEMLAATDVADLLVKQGVPFREAHGIVAGLVRHAVDDGRDLSDLRDDELAELAPAIRDPADFRKVLSNGEWLESKRSRGGTSLDQVRAQLARARALVA
jgi:argininosuccinate lyase